MKKQILITMMVAALSMSATMPVFACNAAGPNKHVGQVTAVNASSGTFTILDAETRKPIVFTASADIIKDAAKAKGSVMVSYEQSNGKMVAKDIHF